MTATGEVSSHTTAACSDCAWTPNQLAHDLSVRVAARQHTDLTQHTVAVFSHTITVFQPGSADGQGPAAAVAERSRVTLGAVAPADDRIETPAESVAIVDANLRANGRAGLNHAADPLNAPRPGEQVVLEARSVRPSSTDRHEPDLEARRAT